MNIYNFQYYTESLTSGSFLLHLKILGMDFIESLPTLIVEMTFSHLKGVEFLNLTLAIPKINKMISNSALLMKNLRFRFEGDDLKPRIRKYSRMDFIRSRNHYFLDFTETLTEFAFATT